MDIKCVKRVAAVRNWTFLIGIKKYKKLNQNTNTKIRVSYNICEDVVFIRTNYAGWIVYLSNGKVKKVLHENYRPRRSEYLKKGRMKCMEGYHKQETSSDNFYDVVEYIKQHDAGMVKRMAKKSRLEKLMEKVEMEGK